jgi:hypothetical protein
MVIVFVAYFRYELIIQLAARSSSFTFVSDMVMLACEASVGLAIVAGLFLVDAIRRLRLSFRENHYFSENRNKMWLHVMAILVQQIALFVLIYFVGESLKYPSHYNVMVNLLRLSVTLVLAISQAIFIYLLIQFTKPIERTWSHWSEASSTSSSNFSLDNVKLQNFLIGKTLSPKAQRQSGSNSLSVESGDASTYKTKDPFLSPNSFGLRKWLDNETSLEAALYF